jgi:hypothetical protein
VRPDFRQVWNAITDSGKKVFGNVFHFKNYQALVKQSGLYVDTNRDKHWTTIEAINNRYDISRQHTTLLNKPLKGTIIFIRRTENKGKVNIMGHQWIVDEYCPNRLVRAEVILNKNISNFTNYEEENLTNNL